LLRQIADAAHRSADPGVQYDTTINKWHTLPNTGRINASNPCSEYMSIDDSACNLASLNLLKFRREDGELDVDAFEHAVDVVFLAQEILGPRAEPRRGARLPQRAGERDRAHRDDQLHDGLRHDGGRAGLLARQVEEARRRRRDHDREQDRADGAGEARLRTAGGRGG